MLSRIIPICRNSPKGGSRCNQFQLKCLKRCHEFLGKGRAHLIVLGENVYHAYHLLHHETEQADSAKWSV